MNCTTLSDIRIILGHSQVINLFRGLETTNVSDGMNTLASPGERGIPKVSLE